jgi:hypothetical protein
VLEAGQRLADEDLRRHAEEAEAIVVGRVTAVEKAGPFVPSEHDPDWWRATVDVDHAEKGGLEGSVQVLFPNSRDVMWSRVPKLAPGQTGLWLLHRTTGDEAALAPFTLLDTDDAHPADHVDRLRPEDG